MNAPIERAGVVNQCETEYTLDDFIQDECERDAAFKKTWNESTSERTLGLNLAVARASIGLTQRDLSSKTGIAQGDISRIESARANPSLKTLKRLADGMGMIVEITFKPKKQD